jgi:hypothetical protein
LRTLIIVRTHRSDPATLRAHDLFAGLADADTIICCDERNATADFGPRDKVGFDNATLNGLGLLPHPNCGWRCGDYAYYVTRVARPGYDFYWLIEPDVLFHTADMESTFASLNASRCDFLAPRLYGRDGRWGWHSTMSSSYDAVFGCNFPITRLSARAIDHLHGARRVLSALDTPDIFETWPNDEVFVATELNNHDFDCKDLNQHLPGTYTPDSLRNRVPHDRARLQAQPPDELIYHPVREFADWFEESSAWAAEYARRRRAAQEPVVRHNVRRLLGLASGSLEHEAFRDAALLPLMLAGRDRRMGTPEAPDTLETEFPDQAQKQDLGVRLLARQFGPRKQGRVFATAHLLAPAEDGRPLAISAQADFALGEAEPLHSLPVRFALPYATDFDDATLLFTIHAQPGAVLSSRSMLDEQRRTAAVGCRAALRHLHRFYGLPQPHVHVELLMIGGAAARAETADRLRATGIHAVVDPPALVQLAANFARFLEVRSHLQPMLLWAALAPVLQVHGASSDAVLVVPPEVGRLKDFLPGARISEGMSSADLGPG